jgi:hypothetical protein
MSLFEIGMLVCFGVAWPFSIVKSYRSRQNAGKSVWFLLVVFTGYVCGFIHKMIHSFDHVIWLYAANGLMVLADIMLYVRNFLIPKAGPGINQSSNL